MFRPGKASRLASALALVAVLLRVMLPGLHLHDHAQGGLAGAQRVLAGERTTVCATCSCGVQHVGGGDVDGGHKRAAPQHDAVDAGHHCLACEIEAGVPCGCPPAADCRAVGLRHAACGAQELSEILAPSQVGLPQPRAPPGQQA